MIWTHDSDSALSLRGCTQHDYEYTHDLHHGNMIDYVDRYWGGWNSEVYAGDFRPDITWIVEQNDDKAGFFVLAFEHTAHLLNLQIDPAFQNQGLGTRVVERCETGCGRRGYDTLFLEAFLNNPARALYERLGYDTYEVTDSHYMMMKPIKVASCGAS